MKKRISLCNSTTLLHSHRKLLQKKKRKQTNKTSSATKQMQREKNEKDREIYALYLKG